MSVTINREEWLAAIREAGLNDDAGDQDALTTSEYADMFDLTTDRASKQLRALTKLGRAVRTFKRRMDASGRLTKCVAYRLIQSNGKKPKVAR
jgi:hypothetical protein